MATNDINNKSFAIGVAGGNLIPLSLSEEDPIAYTGYDEWTTRKGRRGQVLHSRSISEVETFTIRTISGSRDYVILAQLAQVSRDTGAELSVSYFDGDSGMTVTCNRAIIVNKPDWTVSEEPEDVEWTINVPYAKETPAAIPLL